MQLRGRIRKRWSEAGLYSGGSGRLQHFLHEIDATSGEDFTECEMLFRQKYYDLFDQVIPPLAEAEDRGLRMALIQLADFQKPLEMEVMRAFVRNADPQRHRVELAALLERGGDAIRPDFWARPELQGLVGPMGPPQRISSNNMPEPPPSIEPEQSASIEPRQGYRSSAKPSIPPQQPAHDNGAPDRPSKPQRKRRERRR